MLRVSALLLALAAIAALLASAARIHIPALKLGNTLACTCTAISIVCNAANVNAAPTFVEPPLPPLTARQTIVRATNNALASNKVLEAYRKIDQLDDDENEPTSTNTVLLLVPILQMDDEISSIQSQFSSRDWAKLLAIKSAVASEKYNTKALKRTFNKYSDNIYYTDPAKANIYLAGGAMPDSSQTERYLLRNDVITFMGNVRDDFAPSADTSLGPGMDSQLFDDVVDDIRQLSEALKGYLQSCPTDDVSMATKIKSTKK